MYLYAGTVAEAARQVDDKTFIAATEQRFTQVFGVAPSPQEIRSWRRSWPALTRILRSAGLEAVHLLLEYSLPATGERVDAIVVGREAGGRLCAVAIELKQWTHAQLSALRPGMVRTADRIVQHPARQVGGYVHYLQQWVSRDDFPLDVRGIVVLHDAPADLIGGLRTQAARGPAGAYPVLGRDDLTPVPSADDLAQRLGCADLSPVTWDEVERFVQIEHRPSSALLQRAGKVIEGRDAFTLIGDQDLARQEVLHAVDDARTRGRKSIIVVTGGPGTGKTVIACRLLGDLCKQQGSNPRLLSPSGTLTRQLRRTVGNDYRGLIATFLNKTPAGIAHDSVVLLDEAHRARTYPDHQHGAFPVILGKLIGQAAVTVLFLDERQIVRPTEGLTLKQLEQHAQHTGSAFAHIDLVSQFRCNGSHAYQQWIDRLFQPDGTTPAWKGSDYDLAVATDPGELSDWVTDHTRRGLTARVTAGFCWPWDSPDSPPLLPEVAITWQGPEGPRTWTRPWNSRADESNFDHPDVPARPFWATDTGGHDQVGCIYTAQGMEYAYNAVIMGGDLVRRGDRWIAHPEQSHDSQLQGLTPDRYLPYALNTYRVLASRGTKGTRLYSTDTITQDFLQALASPLEA
ncbi:DNA/RNA helicase domain-containing protein [Streptomyces luteocolor]|uniref:DNA/RNA helicase domain-containing protein n=1 Tax=Streptomyces luteocolor TaxID=285500 RepID=UPI000852B0E1|nr:DNA/RNA helicase domain-containing protein [Streptomyces luteocolor]